HSLSWHWSPYLESLVHFLLEIATAVRVFANMLWGFVIVNIIIAIIIIVNLVQNRQYEIDNCIQTLQKQSNVDTSQQSDICTHRETTLIVRNVAIAILLILFSVLFARVSSVYAQKLEMRVKHSRRQTPTTLGTLASISTTEIPIR
ncbi:15221_t:CDS:2, partial [Dentiscutata heterogama]